MTYVPPAIQAAVGFLVIAAGAYDLKYRRVPNWLVLAGLMLAFVLNAFLGGAAGLLLALKGMGLAFLIYFPLYLLRAMGAGDVKLMAAVGAMVGPTNWLVVFFLSAVLGGIVAIAALAARSRVRKGLDNVWLIVTALLHRKVPYTVSPELDVRTSGGIRMPHAAVITFGTLIFLWVAAIYGNR